MTLTLGDALVATLRDWGIDFVFGVSGANIEHVHDAIYRLGDGRIQPLLARTEVGAAFMADAHARVHRTLGVCCATSGGGMMNLAVGIAESFAESVPVLAIVGQPPSGLDGRGAFQDSSGIGRTVNGLQLWGAITKRTERIDDASQFWVQLCAVVGAALEGRMGPVALLIPRDLYDQPVPARPPWVPANLASLRSPVEPDQSAISSLMSLLRAATHPVLVLGTGVSRCAAPGAVAHFAQRTGVAVVTTMGNVNAYDNTADNYLGMIGVAGHPSAHHYLNTVADCIVAVGTGLDIMVRAPIAAGLERAKVAAVNVDLGAISRSVPLTLGVQADAGQVFAAMVEQDAITPMVFTKPDSRISRYVPVLADDRPLGADVLLQSQAISAIETILPRFAHLLFDAGNCAASALHYLSFPPGMTTTIALGMGGMGYAVAGAIGAQLGAVRPTIVLCGDGAFLMHGFEVHTAAARNLPILFVVFNNQSHGMCVTRQQLFFDNRVIASTYADLSVATVAAGLGVWSTAVRTPNELDDALKDYFSVESRPGVLELRMAREELPPFTPFLGKDALTTVR